MYYGPSIILATGISIGSYTNDNPKTGIILNIPLALMNAIGSVVAAFYIDKMGRRYIMLRTLPGVLASLLLVSVSFYFSLYTTGGSKETGNILSFCGLILYLAFFSIGMSSPVWSINTEIYPIHLAGLGTSLATATNWLSNFIVSSVFKSIMETDAGKVSAFLILAFFTILAYIFIYYKVPETNGQPIVVNVDNILSGRVKNTRT